MEAWAQAAQLSAHGLTVSVPVSVSVFEHSQAGDDLARALLCTGLGRPTLCGGM